MIPRPIYLASFILLIGSLLYSCLNSIQSEKQYTSDLRNRIVGARMEKDGISPYHHKWRDGDGLRYYDPANFDSLQVSNITASPFFHHLLLPLAELPQRSCSLVWLFIEYLMLLISVTIAFLMASTCIQKWLVALVTSLFLFTDAWKLHIANGQIYIIIPFLMLLFYFFISRKKINIGLILLAGLTASALILIRSNTILFLIPLLFLYRKFNPINIIVFLIPIVLFASYLFSSQQERMIWNDYTKSLKEQVLVHQGLSFSRQQNALDPKYQVWEGWNKHEVDTEASLHPLHIRTENGNFFVLFQQGFNKKIPYQLLGLLLVSAVVITLILFFIFRYRSDKSVDIFILFALGFCLYMFSDFLSPIYRHQYYTVQWLFPLLLVATHYRHEYKNYISLILLGLLLNIVTLPIRMEHTIGEYMMLAGFLALCFIPNNQEAQKHE